MNNPYLRGLKTRGVLPQEIATRSNDPRFFSALTYLPNPDEILRKLGKSQEIYDQIIYDSHVIGELRAIRSGLLSYEYHLVPGGEDEADLRALELCEKMFAHRPAPGVTWPDRIWTMALAVFRGFSVHEVVWERQDQFLMPGRIIDRPQRRFVFGVDNDLRLVTRQNMVEGEELGDFKWLLSRHMAEFDNPYGVAVLSSCFWPYTFKHGGFKYFMKFCEKYGLPWAIGKYPQGTSKGEQDDLAEKLAAMIEDAVAAVPDNSSVELLEAKGQGRGSHHETLINICNREMSKALTSQTLATEVQDKGARAVSETHRERELDVSESDREIIAFTFDTLLEWVTALNMPSARPPRFEFYEEAEARQDWAELIGTARSYITIPRNFVHEKLGIPLPEAGEEVITSSGPVPVPEDGGDNFTRCPSCGGHHSFAGGEPDAIDALTEQAASQADELLALFGQPVVQLLDRVTTLEEFRDGLDELYPKMDQSRISELVTLASMTARVKGMSDMEGGE